MDWIWKAIVIITVGSLLLRLTGRTSIGKLAMIDVLLMLILGPLFILLRMQTCGRPSALPPFLY
ncbi:hypothetical protein [Paenibacillus sp. LjRoot56]|uniref:hypothetical protein n=1 Tax=Paenibacillus sp. LjRoot56 TaxID=3342333 RepID=UPI003ED07574